MQSPFSGSYPMLWTCARISCVLVPLFYRSPKSRTLACRRISQKLQSKLHNERRKLTRLRRAAEEFRAKLKSCQSSHKHALKCAQSDRAAAIRDEARTRKDAEHLLQTIGDDNQGLRENLQKCRERIRALGKQCKRFPLILEARIEKAKMRPLLFKLKQKGVYSTQARMLARLLVCAGCAQDKVGELMQLFGRILGRPMKDKMSAHTVRRAVFEGGHASDIQTGYELAHTSSGLSSSLLIQHNCMSAHEEVCQRS